MNSKTLGIGVSAIAAACFAFGGLAGVQSAEASLTHNWDFQSGSLADTVSGGPTAALYNGATITAGSGAYLATGGYRAAANVKSFVSLGGYVLPSSGSVTVEAYFTHTGGGIGYFVNGWNFNADTGTTAGGQPGSNSNPTATVGQYFGVTLSQPGRTLGSGQVVPAGSGVDFATQGGNTEQQSNNISANYLDQNGTYVVAAVLDSTAGTLTYYLNGVAQTPVTLSPTQTLSNFVDANSVLGLSAFYGDPSYVRTTYHDFRIYNTALTATQVLADYNTLTPEPAALGILGLGLMGLIMLARRRVRG